MKLTEKKLRKIVREEIELVVEKSKSKAQQRLMGMALSVKRGEADLSDMPEDVRDDIKSMVDSMTEKELEDYASTSHEGLPDHVKSD